jgi:hypothetical protein
MASTGLIIGLSVGLGCLFLSTVVAIVFLVSRSRGTTWPSHSHFDPSLGADQFRRWGPDRRPQNDSSFTTQSFEFPPGSAGHRELY